MNNARTVDGLQTRTGSRVAYFSLLLLALTAATACSAIDYSYRSNQFADSARKERSLGTIHFHYGDGEETYDVNIHKVRRGYALSAPLYREDAMSINFTTSRTKDSGSFVGLRSRWEF